MSAFSPLVFFLRRKRAGQPFQPHMQTGEGLAEFIVQVHRQPLAFVFDSRYEPAGQVPDFIFGLPPLRYVA